MKFLLAIGLVSTGFSLFLIHQTWKISNESLHQMLSQQAEMAMAFDVAMQEINQHSHKNKDYEGSENAFEICNFGPETVKAVFGKVQSTNPQVIIYSTGKQLSKILNQSGEASGIYTFFDKNPAQESLDKVVTFNGLKYLAKFRLNRDDISITEPQAGLRMIAVPLEGYQSRLNEMTMVRFSKLMIALLVLLGGIYLSFNLIVSRPLKKIIAHFRDITNHDNEICFEPLNIQSKDEIGVLADSFNGLGKKLQSIFDTLETKVRKRTNELQQANTNLQQKVNQCRRAEERANILAEEATSANRAKTEFLSNMSHELRTPMNAIMGFSHVLSEEMSGGEHLAYVKLITENSQRLLMMIDDLLDYTRIESGKMNLDIKNCNIRLLVEEIESLLRPEAEKKGIDFQILQCDLIPEVILTDPLRLKQCLINLVENAIKFTENGHVYVNVTIESCDDDPILWFDIEDTGIGIAEEQLPRVFDVFMQADSAMTRKYGGTGLGLAITKHFIELLGGHISVRSTLGRGSVFTLQIPAGVQWPDEEAAVWNKYLEIDDINEF